MRKEKRTKLVYRDLFHMPQSALISSFIPLTFVFITFYAFGLCAALCRLKSSFACCFELGRRMLQDPIPGSFSAQDIFIERLNCMRALVDS
jgi:hypothetical protein